ncbi:MAG: amidase [Verrucomicrobiales bacterium]|nr:amidase [Verrucomicrobiales bacterium]
MIPLSGCQQGEGKKTGRGDLEGEAAVDDFVLNEVTVELLQQKMERGSETARSITELYLQRIEEIDRAGPKLKSVIEVNPEALQIADELDAERAAGKVRGALHGVPVMIKDNIGSADQMQTTAGSLALAGSKTKRDSQVVQKLRQAGAVILGKTNLSEWANFRSVSSSSGWSSRGGQTRNPYVLDRTPCGSSAGSAVAVAANLCALAVGTETSGSLVCPSSVNGIVGIKPTVGLIGRSGIIPISETQDTAGPMARTVRDAAILLGALTGGDERDARTLESEGKSHDDYTKFLSEQGLKEVRLGVPTSLMGVNAEADHLLVAALDLLEQQGAELVKVEGELVAGAGEVLTVLLYEFKHGLNRYLQRDATGAEVKSLTQVLAFNREHVKRVMPFFKQELLELAESKGDLQSEEYLQAREKSLKGAREEGLDRVMTEHKLDGLVASTSGPAWATDLLYGDRRGTGGCAAMPAQAGYPHITVPMGSVHGLPVGLSFFGKAWSEPTLLKMAYAYEQASKKRVAPEFKDEVM